MTSEQVDANSRFREMFDAHYPSVWSYCRRRLPAADVDDTVAEVFTVAWRRLEAIPAEPLTRAWLLRTAYHVGGHALRSNGRRSRLQDVAGADRSVAPPADDLVGAIGSNRGLADAMARLSADDRELLRLIAWEELTRDEIATVLGCSANAVAIRLHRARRRLEHLLTPETGLPGADESFRATSQPAHLVRGD